MPGDGRFAADAALFIAAAAVLVSVVTDLRSRLILNKVTLPALALVLLCEALAEGPQALRGAAAGIAVCAGPFLLASLRGWMGMGDVKLMAVVGAFFAWPSALAALFWVTVAGGVQAVLQLALARVRRREAPRYVPYACAIAAGSLAAFFWGIP